MIKSITVAEEELNILITMIEFAEMNYASFESTYLEIQCCALDEDVFDQLKRGLV